MADSGTPTPNASRERDADWLRFRDDAVPDEPAVSLDAFLDQSNAFSVRIEAGDDVKRLIPHLDRVQLVEVDFPRFRDGRGFSTARILREAGYTGEIKATGDVLVIQDADLEYDPNDFKQLILPIAAGDADVVYGSRFMRRAGARPALRRWHWFGNALLTAFSNRFTGLGLTDMETCYKMLRRDVAARLDLQSRDFAMEPEITCKVARMGVRLRELPIAYQGRTYDEGKKIGMKDAVKAVSTTLKYSRWTPGS